MHDFLFVSSFMFFPLVVLFFFKYLNLNFFRISLPSTVILFMFTFAYIGILPLYFGWARTTGTCEEKLLITMVFFGSSLSICGLLVGFMLSRSILNLRVEPLRIKSPTLTKGDMLGLIITLFISSIILAVYISKIDRIALFVALRDGITEAKVARSAMGNAFQEKYHWYRLFFREILSFVSFTFFSNWLLKKRKSSFFLFTLSFFFTSFAALMATEKAPFVWLIVGLFLTFLITRRQGRVPVKSIVLLFSSMLAIVPIMYIFFMGSRDWQSGATSLFSRAFTGGITPASFYLEVFPAQKDFLLGQTFPNPGGILPFKPYRYTVELMNMRFPHLQEMGIVGSMPTAFWGEAYINFGWTGVFIIPVILGAWIWIVAYAIGKMKDSPIKNGALVLSILHFKDISVSGFSGFFIDTGLISIFIILFFNIRLARLISATVRKLKARQKLIEI
jgi:oligosaccharide repeat unit polymerase